MLGEPVLRILWAQAILPDHDQIAKSGPNQNRIRFQSAAKVSLLRISANDVVS